MVAHEFSAGGPTQDNDPLIRGATRNRIENEKMSGPFGAQAGPSAVGRRVRARGLGQAVCRALGSRIAAELADMVRRTAERVEHILLAHGRSLDPELADD
jgi:hypothetical protein